MVSRTASSSLEQRFVSRASRFFVSTTAPSLSRQLVPTASSDEVPQTSAALKLQEEVPTASEVPQTASGSGHNPATTAREPLPLQRNPPTPRGSADASPNSHDDKNEPRNNRNKTSSRSILGDELEVKTSSRSLEVNKTSSGSILGRFSSVVGTRARALAALAAQGLVHDDKTAQVRPRRRHEALRLQYNAQVSWSFLSLCTYCEP